MGAIDARSARKRLVWNRRGEGAKVPIVCTFWVAGTCTRNPCKFLHSQAEDPRSAKRMRPDPITKSREKVCDYWVSGNCFFGDKCRFLHSWCESNDNFSMVARLEGHKKAVTGIEFPVGSGKLYSGSRDGTMRIWDCQSGQCVKVVNCGGEIGCFISMGCWIFVGLLNLVKAFRRNPEIGGEKEVRLAGPVGLVNSMVAEYNKIFAGGQDGVISVWECNLETDSTSNSFQFASSLKGHTNPVICMAIGRDKVYSGSADGSIRVWDFNKLECKETLKEHGDVVMSLLCWDQFLLSCSLDGTIHVWGMNADESGLEVVHKITEEEGILALFGMEDAESKSVLFCCLKDNSVRLYELPSFAARGKIFGKRQVEAFQRTSDGLFFTADATGVVSVWKWLPKQAC